MNNSTQGKKVGSLRRYLFFRLQFLTSIGLIGVVAIGMIGIQHYTATREASVALSLLFVMLAIFMASSQVIAQYAIIARFLAPLGHLAASIRDCTGTILAKNSEEIAQQVQAYVADLRALHQRFGDRSSEEIRLLYMSFIQILQVLESSSEQLTADSTLRAMGQVCRRVAHDMRSPVTVLRTVLQHIQREVALVGDTKAAVEAGLRSCERLGTMAEELLDYNRAQAVEIRAIDLAQVVQTVTAELRAAAAPHGIAVEFHGPENLQARGDADKLTRVVQNLVQNAMQAMEGKVPDGTVRVLLESWEEAVAIHIDDTGPGIPPEHLDKLFSYQFTTKGNKGTGLGLLYCHEVIRAHGGRVTVANREPCGARFTITLPNPVLH